MWLVFEKKNKMSRFPVKQGQSPDPSEYLTERNDASFHSVPLKVRIIARFAPVFNAD